MINVYKSQEQGLASIDEFLPNSWVNVVDPDDEEITRLCQILDIPQDFISASLDIDERSRMDREENALLILLRVPYHAGESADVPYATIPLGIILTEDLIVTVSKLENVILQDFLDGKVSGFSTAKRNRFILRILLRTAKQYLRDLRIINRQVDILEDKLQRSMRNEELLGLLKYQKSLVYFTTALRSNELMMERLQRSRLFEQYPEDGELLDDVLTENRQAIEMVGIASDILSQMMDAFASIISNNLNVVMKFLTSATIILMIPTLVASFYGMNVGLPLQNSPYAFLLTLVLSFAMSIVVVYIFWKKDWF